MKLKRVLAICMAFSMIAVPSAFAGTGTMPCTVDFEDGTTGFAIIANMDEDNTNWGIVEDSEDSDNHVLRETKVGSLQSDLRLLVSRAKTAYSFSYDICREALSGNSYIKMCEGSTGSAVTCDASPFLISFSNGNVTDTNSNKLTTYDANTWYSVRIDINNTITQLKYYIKKRSEGSYTYLGSATLPAVDLNKTSDLFYCGFTADSWVYYDNFSLKQINDFTLPKGFRDEFNNVSAKSGGYYTYYKGTSGAKWSGETFDGASVLKLKQSLPTAQKLNTFNTIENIDDKVVAVARMGVDKAGETLPLSVGVIPAFCFEDGSVTKDDGEGGTANINENSLLGITLDENGELYMEGEQILNDSAPIVLQDGKLYDMGYIYERADKKLTAFFIDTDGTIYTKDASEELVSSTSAACDLDGLSPVQEQRYLGALKIFQQSGSGHFKGASFWDYIRIDEYNSLEVSDSTISDGDSGVTLNPEIGIKYNCILDQSTLGTVTLVDSKGNSVPCTLEANGASEIDIDYGDVLEPLTTYTLTVGGAVDFFGKTAGDYSVTFTTGSAVMLSSVSRSGDTLSYTIESKDGKTENATVIAVAFDEAGSVIGSAAERYNTIANNKSTTGSITVEPSGTVYRYELYVWDSLASTNPFMYSSVFGKKAKYTVIDSSLLLNTTYDRDTEVATIYGKATPNAYVTLEVFPKGYDYSSIDADSIDLSNVKYIKQVTADDDGNYITAFNLNFDSGKYAIRAYDATSNVVDTANVSMYYSYEVQSLLTNFSNATTIDEVKAIFTDENADILGIDNTNYTALSQDKQTELASAILTEKSNVIIAGKITNFNKALELGQLLYDLNNSLDATAFGKVFEAGLDLLALTDAESGNIYTKYLSNTLKATLYGILEKRDYASLAEVKAYFRDQAFLVASCNQEQYNIIGKVFEEADVFETLSTGKFTKLTSSQKITVYKSLNQQKTPYSTLDELGAQIRKLSDSASSSSKSSGGSGGGGGGGGSSSGLEQITTTKQTSSLSKVNAEWLCEGFNLTNANVIIEKLMGLVK